MNIEAHYPKAEPCRGMINGPHGIGRALQRAQARATSRAVRKAQRPDRAIKGLSTKRARTVLGEQFYGALVKERIAHGKIAT